MKKKADVYLSNSLAKKETVFFPSAVQLSTSLLPPCL